MGPAPGGPDVAPDAVWERRHPELPESWSFDFVVPDGSFGGFVALTIWPSRRRAWFWAAVVGRRRPYLLVRDLDVPAPRSPASREIRSEALWAGVNCETPHDHWSVGMEAFGVSMDDPDDALGDERGERRGLGMDLEWESAAPVAGDAGGYAQACAVHGDVLIGGGRGDVEAVAVDGFGWRHHAWGTAVDWFAPAHRVAGRLDTGVPCHLSDVDQRVVSVLHRAPLRLELAHRRATLERTICRFRTPGGEAGLGWSERVLPAPRTARE